MWKEKREGIHIFIVTVGGKGGFIISGLLREVYRGQKFTNIHMLEHLDAVIPCL